MRTATITAVSGKTITIFVAGGLITSGVGCLESYTPVVGDTVAVFRQDSSWLILGAVANTTGWGTRTGTVNMSVTAAASVTQAVSFGVTFAQAPVVVPNIDSGAGVTARWVPRAISIGTTGFTMFLFAADAVAGTFSNVPVSWVATAR
jgi:hypothetical protein